MTTAAELKQQLAELAKKRHLIEEETSAATARLNATGMGMDTPLVDREVRAFSTLFSTTITTLTDRPSLASSPT